MDTFDLNSFIAGYKGRTRLTRLSHIANICPFLAHDALSLALRIIEKEYLDVALYEKLSEKLSTLDTGFLADSKWIESTSQNSKVIEEKLEMELKSYRNNLIKESIRMAHGDIAEHHYSSGNLLAAARAYSRMRDYCTTSKQILDMYMSNIQVSIEMSDFTAAANYVAKIRALTDCKEKEELVPKINVVEGLVALANAKYKDAAKAFLEVPASLGIGYSHVASMNDIAWYVVLCALASFSRTELVNSLVKNADFAPVLELDPLLREMLFMFLDSRYSELFTLLQKQQCVLETDIYLINVLEEIYRHIRQHCILQYFTPYTTIELSKMATAFNTDPTSLQQELKCMVENGTLKGRLDTAKGRLVACKTNPRINVLNNVIRTTTQYEQTAKLLLLRANLTQVGLEVRRTERFMDLLQRKDIRYHI